VESASLPGRGLPGEGRNSSKAESAVSTLFNLLALDSLWKEMAYPSVDTVPRGSGAELNHVLSLSKQSSNHSVGGMIGVPSGR